MKSIEVWHVINGVFKFRHLINALEYWWLVKFHILGKLWLSVEQWGSRCYYVFKHLVITSFPQIFVIQTHWNVVNVVKERMRRIWRVIIGF
jgi:hypothetical protein